MNQSGINTLIRLNSLGFLPAQQKVATIAESCDSFSVLNENGNTVYAGIVSGPILSSDTGETLYKADFTEVKTPGSYKLHVPGLGYSVDFQIGDNIYNQAFRTAMIGMYLWRCGTAVSAEHNGITFKHEACHCDDAWLDYTGVGHIKKLSTGGWHDAGDYNKYVVNAGVTLGLMFKAWEQFKERVSSCSHLSENAGPFPDYLLEIKWEIDWLLTMQFESGAVSHKISAKRFCPFILPEKELEPRFFTDWGSTATADFIAMLSMASRVFRPYDEAYAEICLTAAWKSYTFLIDNPQQHDPDQTDFHTGGYTADDGVHRLWAAAELWETTGENRCLEQFELRAGALDSFIDMDFNWRDVKNLAIITYVNSTRSGKNPVLVENMKKAILSSARQMVINCNEHAYGRSLGASYCWGGNSNLLNTVFILHAAYDLSGDEAYRNTSLDAIGFIFGRNRYCRSFVTGVGFNPPQHPHDRRSGGDDIVEPWPGYLVGGPNKNANDYQDSQPDCFTNEIAVNWNASLIYALSGFVDFR